MTALFSVAQKSFEVVDRVVLARLPEHVRSRAYEIAAEAKRALFPHASRGLPGGSITDLVAHPGALLQPPDWLINEIAALRRDVDPGLFASGLPKPSNYQRRYPAGHRTGDVYMTLAARMAEMPSPTHYVAVPWLKRGGADMVVLRTVEAIISAGGRPVVLTTEAAESPWLERLPPDVPTLDLGHALAGLRESQKLVVLARLLLQFPAKTLHIINSRLAWDCTARYGRAVANQTRIFASLFCDDFIDGNGIASGYAHQYLQRCDASISGYVSDNASYPEKLARLYGIDPGKFHTAFVPTDLEYLPLGLVHPDETTRGPGSGNVLWAGRLDTQKRPDLLLAIARAMPDIRFEVYGAPLLHSDRSILKLLSEQANVVMKGPFDGFDRIPAGRYAAMLYTSRWDGLPNILLEAGIRQVPLVASDVGGVHELVSDATGWSVRHPDDPQAYVQALRDVMERPIVAWMRTNACRDLIRTRHNVDAFNTTMATIPAYMGISIAPAPSDQ